MSADRPERTRTLRKRVRAHVTALLTMLLTAAAVVTAPAANAMVYGNYALNIQGRFDFHTWIWFIAPCDEPDCVWVRARHQPIARAYPYADTAHLADGRYTLTVDDPYGLRCGNVYYGPTIPTHDVYTWDAVTLAGSMVSTFDAGCDGQPGAFTYPFWLTRM